MVQQLAILIDSGSLRGPLNSHAKDQGEFLTTCLKAVVLKILHYFQANGGVSWCYQVSDLSGSDLAESKTKHANMAAPFRSFSEEVFGKFELAVESALHTRSENGSQHDSSDFAMFSHNLKRCFVEFSSLSWQLDLLTSPVKSVRNRFKRVALSKQIKNFVFIIAGLPSTQDQLKSFTRTAAGVDLPSRILNSVMDPSAHKSLCRGVHDVAAYWINSSDLYGISTAGEGVRNSFCDALAKANGGVLPLFCLNGFDVRLQFVPSQLPSICLLNYCLSQSLHRKNRHPDELKCWPLTVRISAGEFVAKCTPLFKCDPSRLSKWKVRVLGSVSQRVMESITWFTPGGLFWLSDCGDVLSKLEFSNCMYLVICDIGENVIASPWFGLLRPAGETIASLSLFATSHKNLPGQYLSKDFGNLAVTSASKLQSTEAAEFVKKTWQSGNCSAKLAHAVVSSCGMPEGHYPDSNVRCLEPWFLDSSSSHVQNVHQQLKKKIAEISQMPAVSYGAFAAHLDLLHSRKCGRSLSKSQLRGSQESLSRVEHVSERSRQMARSIPRHNSMTSVNSLRPDSSASFFMKTRETRSQGFDSLVMYHQGRRQSLLNSTGSWKLDCSFDGISSNVASFVREQIQSRMAPVKIFFIVKSAIASFCRNTAGFDDDTDVIKIIRSDVLKSSKDLDVWCKTQNVSLADKLEMYKLQGLFHLYCLAEPPDDTVDVDQYLEEVFPFFRWIHLSGDKNALRNILDDVLDCFVDSRPTIVAGLFDGLQQPVPDGLSIMIARQQSLDSPAETPLPLCLGSNSVDENYTFRYEEIASRPITANHSASNLSTQAKRIALTPQRRRPLQGSKIPRATRAHVKETPEAKLPLAGRQCKSRMQRTECSTAEPRKAKAEPYMDGNSLTTVSLEARSSFFMELTPAHEQSSEIQREERTPLKSPIRVSIPRSAKKHSTAKQCDGLAPTRDDKLSSADKGISNGNGTRSVRKNLVRDSFASPKKNQRK